MNRDMPARMKMAAQLRELLRLDRSAVDLRKGLTGLAAIAIAIAFLAIFKTAGLAAGLALLFTIQADQPGPLRTRAVGILVMTLGGSAIAFVAIWAGTETAWAAILLTFAVTVIGTLVAGVGAAAATRGLLLSIWAVVALSLGGELEAAVNLTIAFAAGGIIAAAIIWLRTRAMAEPPIADEEEAVASSLGQLLRSPLGWFALLRASAVTLAMALGIAFFPAHPTWAAITVIIVMRPKAGETIAVGVLRTLGTVLGLVAAALALFIFGHTDAVLFVGFLVAGFGMAALAKVNYAIMVACLTALLVFATELVSGTGESAAVDRLLGTIAGAAIAFVAIGIGRWILARQGGVSTAVVGVGDGAAQPGDEVPG